MRERSSPPGRGVSRRGAGEPWVEKARLLLSLVTVRGYPSESAIPRVFLSGRERGPEGLERVALMLTQSTAAARSNTVGSISHFR